MRTNITTPTAGLTVYPEAGDVFVIDDLGLGRYLHPLLTVDLALIDPSWDGQVHLLSPVEPHSGTLGEDADEHWTELVRENWLAFSLEDGRYRFLASPDYFELARLDADPRVQGFPSRTTPPPREELRAFHTARRLHERWEELGRHYDEQHASYDTVKAHHAEHGMLCPEPYGSTHQHVGHALVEQLGGPAGRAAWTEWGTHPVDVAPSPDPSQDDEIWPLSPEGRRFAHVASVTGSHYRRSGADLVSLFYEPVSRIALLAYDWS